MVVSRIAIATANSVGSVASKAPIRNFRRRPGRSYRIAGEICRRKRRQQSKKRSKHADGRQREQGQLDRIKISRKRMPGRGHYASRRRWLDMERQLPSSDLTISQVRARTVLPLAVS